MTFAKHVLIFTVMLMIPTAALAQTKVEISPYVSWRHGSDISDISGVAVNLESGTAYGFMVDVSITPNLQVEFIYSYFNTGGTLRVPPGLPEAGPVGTFDISGNVDYYQGGLLYQFDLANPKVKPFIVGTIGAASMRSELVDTSNTNLSFGFGGGVKFFFSDHVGIRTEYRLFSTSTNFVGRGGWCDWWGFCYTFLTSKYLYQSQFSAALIFGF